jgi:hypothetical protein
MSGNSSQLYVLEDSLHIPSPRPAPATVFKGRRQLHKGQSARRANGHTSTARTETLPQWIPRQLSLRSEKTIKSSTTTTRKITAQRIVTQSGCESFGGWPIQRRNQSPNTPLIIPSSEKRPRNRKRAPNEPPSVKTSFSLALPTCGACA